MQPSRGRMAAVLERRLHPPEMFVELVQRRRVVDRVLRGLSRRIVSLQAPAGFGKTCVASLVAQHDKLSEQGRKSVWITAQELDRNPAFFFNDLTVALHHVGVTIRRGQSHVSRNGEAQLWLDLLGSIQEYDKPLLLVVDNIDQLGREEALPEAIRFLGLLPQSVCVLITSRCVVQPFFPEFATAGLIEHIEARDLCFSLNEMDRLLGAKCGREDVRALHRASMGWPALVQQALHSHPGASQLHPRDFDDAHPPAFDFYIDVLRKELSPSFANLLEACCFVDDFTLDLAEQVSGIEISRSLRHEIEQSFPLVSRSGPSPHTYKILPAIRTALMRAANDGSEVKVRTHHKRAADWYARHGKLQRAVRHASLAQDYGLASQLVNEAGGARLFLQAGSLFLQALLNDLPRDVRNATPSLELCQAVIEAKAGRVNEARQLLKDLENRLRQGLMPGWQGEELVHITTLIDIYCDEGAAIEDSGYLEALLRKADPSAEWEVGWICNHLTVTYFREGQLEKAIGVATRSLVSYRLQDMPYAQVFLLTHLGLISTVRGKLSSATDYLGQAEALAQATQWEDKSLIAIVRVGLMELAYFRGRSDQLVAARDDILRSLLVSEGWVDLYERMLEVSALTEYSRRGLKAALRYVEQGEEVAVERGLARLSIFAKLLNLKLLVRDGQIEAATAIAARITIPDRTELHCGPGWTWREMVAAYGAMARLRSAQQHWHASLVLLGQAEAIAKQVGANLFLVEIKLIEATCQWHLGAEDAALRAFLDAVAEATPQGICQPFFEQEDTLNVMLQKLTRKHGLRMFSQPAATLITQILRPSSDPASSSLRSLLNMRERQILDLLREGKSNKTIARRLEITEATVKYHLGNLYMKLGVNSRSLAVAVAHEHDLGPSDEIG